MHHDTLHITWHKHTTTATSGTIQTSYESWRQTKIYQEHKQLRSGSKVSVQVFFTAIAGLETSFRPYLLKCGAPNQPGVIVRQSLANKEEDECISSSKSDFITPFLVSSSHETLVKKIADLGGKGYRRTRSLRE